MEFDVEKILLQLKRWQEKLLDTSKANPLLGLNRARAAKIKIINPSYPKVFQKLSLEEGEFRLPFVKREKKQKLDSNLFNVVEESDGEKETYKVEQGDIEFEFDAPLDLKRKLRRIYDNSRTTVEERGVITLYITFGVIRWYDEVLGDSVSPILLVPCELISKGPNVGLRLRVADEEVQINPAMVYYFKEKYKIELPELPQDDKGAIVLEVNTLEILYKKISESISDRDWKVDNEIWLGTFSFESLVLYQDLKLLTQLACTNPLIAAFAHASDSNGTCEVLGDDLDSMEIPGVVPVPVLPADSSQLKALTYASLGQHLVVHGPPGTGKSQTISNIIADALGHGKKVLFVSAKMAALNVVFDRLKTEGLGQFCLEAHGVKAGKLKIIEELKRTLESEDFDNIGPLEQELESLKSTREKLNEYVLALNTIISPLGLTIFQAIGRFSKLHKIPDIRLTLPWEDVLEVSEIELNNVLDALKNIAQMADLFNNRKNHPWRGFSNLEFNIQIQEQVENDLKFLSQRFADIDKILQRLKKLLPKNDFTLNEIIVLSPVFDAISKIKKLPANWWDLSLENLQEKENLFKEASLLTEEYKEKKQLYNQYCDFPPNEIVDLLKELDTLYKAWFSRFKVSYFQWKSQIKKKFKQKTKLGYENLRDYYVLAKRLSEIEVWFKVKTQVLSLEVTSKQMTDSRAFDDVVSQCEVALLIKNHLLNYDWKNSKIIELDPEVTNAASVIVSTLADQSKAINDAIERIEKCWSEGFLDGVKILQMPIVKFKPRAEEVLAHLDKSHEWLLLFRVIKHCENLGLTSFLESVNMNSLLLPSIFEKRFFAIWLDTAINKTEILAEFTGMKQQELIEKLRVLDGRIRRLANVHIKAGAVLASRQVKSAQAGMGNGSEIGILRFEMQKRKRIKPLRKLFSQIPHVLQALKPCMLMSPLSVSTYLKPEDFHFNLVIFDEASQLPTPEAIPSILRADQVIVAGDSKQLPPTSFFNSTIDEENEDFDSDDLESLLDNCVALISVFQETPLKWHYRSRDERLINFSNHYFYDNKLITFPSVRIDNFDRGVRLEYLPNGVWDRGRSRTNRQEARRAAQIAIKHFIDFPERTLGIVAFNTSQREAIEDALNEELVQKPELLPFFDSSRKEPFFVKSLESVQGDERDVIIVSVGYAKSADGNFTLNFGPLNSEGGERRLNVLVTRAKWQTILLTSIRSSELSRVNSQNQGAMSLKNYIEYAEREGSLPPDSVRLTEGETNDFEDSIREVLVDRGYSVDVQVGAGNFRIDLAVRDPKDLSRFLIGIECDGAKYHSSRVARDRDLLRQEILQGMGWKFHRVWSTEWFHNRDMAIKLMLDSIERAEIINSSSKYISAPLEDGKEYIFNPLPAPKLKRRFKQGILYSKYQKRFERGILIRGTNIYKLVGIIEDIVRLEGPIHKELLFSRLKEVFEVEKIGTNITSNIDIALEYAVKNKILGRKKSFIWKSGNRLSLFRVPGDGVKRPLCHISPQEISLAILYLTEDQFGIIREQIPQYISRIFEISRTDSEEIDRIREIIDKLVEAGFLVTNGVQVNLAPNKK